MPRYQSPVTKTYSVLLKGILSGKIKSGEKLREEKLCKEFNVSRTPVREALMRLVQNGLVEKVPRYGCQVKEVSSRDIVELFECRSFLEPEALKLAAKYIDEEATSAVLETLNEVERAEDARSASVIADQAMHAIVTDFCPNNHLVDLIKNLQLQTEAFRNFRAYKVPDLAVVSNERYSIVNAIAEGNIEQAALLLREHIMRGAEALEL